MKNLFYLLFVLPLLFSCGEGEVEEEKQEKVYHLTCWENQPVYVEYEQKIKGSSGEWKGDGKFQIQISKNDYENASASINSKKLVKDINGNEYNVYITSMGWMVENEWKKNKLKRDTN